MLRAMRVLFEASSSLSTSVNPGVAECSEIREKKTVTQATSKRMAAVLAQVAPAPVCSGHDRIRCDAIEA
jgi:hypothetical protein